jgi:hypothetical protein
LRVPTSNGPTVSRRLWSAVERPDMPDTVEKVDF